MPRIEIIRCAIKLIKTCQKLCRVASQPGCWNQGSGRRAHDPVRIAVLPDKARFLSVTTGYIDDKHGSRQEATILIDRQDFVRAQALSTRNTTHVREDQVDGIDLRMRLEKGLGLGKVGNRRGTGGCVGHSFHPVRVCRQSSSAFARRSTWSCVVAGQTSVIL